MKIYDLGVGENGRLLIENGDFVIKESNQESASAIIRGGLGSWKFNPNATVAIKRFLNSAGTSQRIVVQNLIKRKLEDDGFKVQDLKVVNDVSSSELQIKTNAERGRL